MLKPKYAIEYKGEFYWYNHIGDFNEMVEILKAGKHKFRAYAVKYEKVWTKNGTD